MQAHFIEDWAQEQQEYEDEAPPLRRAWSAELKEAAAKDMEGVLSHLSRVGLRKASPRWSLPVPVF
jgi:hypothetical protein